MAETKDERTPMLCASCGIRQTTKISSGSPECWQCWDWRKLNGPAARYWVKAIDRLFFDPETGSSGPDAIDSQQWENWEMRESVVKALYTLQAIGLAYQAEIDHWAAEGKARWAGTSNVETKSSANS